MSDISLLGIITFLFYALGILGAGLALWRSRTPQGAVAWIVALLSFPFLAVPLFAIFGRSRFQGYLKKRTEFEGAAEAEIREAELLYHEQVMAKPQLRTLASTVDHSRQPVFTGLNQTQLLIDGEAAFRAMLDEIARAEKYILLQMYIFRADGIGHQFAEALLKKASEGVRVYLLFDRIGTDLKSSFVDRLRRGGISLEYFRSTKSWRTRFQINFRNHRKVLIVDGNSAFVGGLNIGDDYLGRWKSVGPWRDTHLRLQGPAALAAQLSFVKDWYWSTEEIPNLDWNATRYENGADALVLHTGPADQRETCLLSHIAMINSAVERIWIANPYFVPPEGIINALTLAGFRGVDVRVLLPSYSDNRWVMYASEVYIGQLIKDGVQFYRYLPGFMHQKVMLIDNEAVTVGSANLDSRSFFINFEITAISADPNLISDVSRMLQSDFQKSRLVTPDEMNKRSFPRRLLSRAVHLASPIL